MLAVTGGGVCLGEWRASRAVGEAVVGAVVVVAYLILVGSPSVLYVDIS